MLLTKFHQNRSTRSGEDFEGFLPYMDVAAILIMRPASCQYILITMYLKAYVQILVQNGPVVSEKS